MELEIRSACPLTSPNDILPGSHPGQPIARFPFNGVMAQKVWTHETAPHLYRLVTGGIVKVVRFELSEVAEDLRRLFTIPSITLFSGLLDKGLMNMGNLDFLDVQLDWPVGSQNLTICIRRKQSEASDQWLQEMTSMMSDLRS